MTAETSSPLACGAAVAAAAVVWDGGDGAGVNGRGGATAALPTGRDPCQSMDLGIYALVLKSISII